MVLDSVINSIALSLESFENDDIDRAVRAWLVPTRPYSSIDLSIPLAGGSAFIIKRLEASLNAPTWRGLRISEVHQLFYFSEIVTQQQGWLSMDPMRQCQLGGCRGCCHGPNSV